MHIADANCTIYLLYIQYMYVSVLIIHLQYLHNRMYTSPVHVIYKNHVVFNQILYYITSYET